MNQPTGACPSCGDANPYTNTVCSGCGRRLPWADALDENRRQRIAAEQAAEQAKREAEALVAHERVVAQRIADGEAQAARAEAKAARSQGSTSQQGTELEELQKIYYRGEVNKNLGQALSSFGCMCCWAPPLLLFLYALFMYMIGGSK